MSGFQALLAAFFGHQGEDVGAGLGDPSALKGKVAFALKADSKAGQTTMDDALNSTPDSGEPTTDKTVDIAAPDNLAAATGLSLDAQALAALFAAPLQKPPAVDETTATPPAGQAATAAKDAAVPAAALIVAETPEIDLAGAAVDGAEDAKTDAAAGQVTVANGRSKLMAFAETLAANRQGAAKAADPVQPAYRHLPPPRLPRWSRLPPPTSSRPSRRTPPPRLRWPRPSFRRPRRSSVRIAAPCAPTGWTPLVTTPLASRC
jgi:hypothetical protein